MGIQKWYIGSELGGVIVIGYSLDEFIRKNDTDDKIKMAIMDCITENMSRELAIDILAEDLQIRLYEFIDSSEVLSIDDGSNVRRDFTNAIRTILSEYFKIV